MLFRRGRAGRTRVREGVAALRAAVLFAVFGGVRGGVGRVGGFFVEVRGGVGARGQRGGNGLQEAHGCVCGVGRGGEGGRVI